jgi:uncharacterized protein YcbK (DUF882 family)
VKGKLDNLHPDLLAILQKIEDMVDIELTINSGYRTPAHNAAVNGVEHSEHTYNPAKAADILCLRSVTRWNIVKAAIVCGVRRVGIGQDFVHIGIATDKPQDVMWLYDRDLVTPDPLSTSKEV